jgi:hypothetical protein
MAFLVILKNLLPGKSVSIAAPSSYWYLKPFPIAQMSKFLDYIVFMTYDLHGQVRKTTPLPKLTSGTATYIVHTHCSGTRAVTGPKMGARTATASVVISI